MKIVLRNLIRHSRKNTVMFFTVAFSAVLANSYMNNLDSCQRQLRELADVTPVYCYITNMTGSNLAGLDINERIVRQLEDSEHTRDVAYTVKVNGGIGDIPLSEWYKLGYNLIGLNSIDALSDLEYEDITLPGDKDAFFSSDENTALFSAEFMEKNNLSLGDEVPLTLYYYQYDETDIYCHPLDKVTVKIAGTVSKRVAGPEGAALDILIPAAFLKKVFDKSDVRFFADSLSFYLADPLRLNEAKEEFKSMYLLSRSSSARPSYIGLALNIQDATFISLAENLMRNITLQKALIIPLFFLITALGFLISFILIKNREREYITMRLLGVCERSCAILYCGEVFILSVLGAAAGCLITAIFIKADPAPVPAVTIAAACLTGTFAALHTAKKEMRENSTWK